MEKYKTSLLYNLVSAALAFVLWGSWAYFVNHSLISALTQGTASFLITLILVKTVAQLYHVLSGRTGVFLHLSLPAFITVGFTGSCLFLAHRFAGTAHIFETIAPALSVALVFCIVTTLKLQKGNEK